MTSARAAALSIALCLAAPAARAQDAPDTGSGVTVENPEAEVARRVADVLRTDPGAQAALAHRLMSSSLAESLAGGATNRDDAEAAVFHWVQQHPDDASHLAVGFASDDQNGSHDFETSLHERVVRSLALNPDRYTGILGVLQAAGSQSKIISKLEKKMDEEEQRELLKRLFEGKGGEQGRVLKQPDEGKDNRTDRPSSSAPGVAAPGAYDRISELNPSGYSPQVLALQSALNAQRAPGAPKVPETGRLDYATLAAPSYSLHGDLERQDAALRAQRAWETARALGRAREFRPEQYSDKAVQAKLEAAGAGVKIAPRTLSRRNALARARAAVQDFEREAEAMRDPSKITRGGLKRLAARQREAARWLLIADLEGDLARVEAEADFWTPELERLVTFAPAPEDQRRAFLARAHGTKERIERIRSFDEAARGALEAPDYSARWAWINRQVAEANAQRPNLSRDISLLVGVPPGFCGSRAPEPAWRERLERWVLRLAPWSAWGRELAAREHRRAVWADAFLRVASGDFAAAQRAAMEASR